MNTEVIFSSFIKEMFGITTFTYFCFLTVFEPKSIYFFLFNLYVSSLSKFTLYIEVNRDDEGATIIVLKLSILMLNDFLRSSMLSQSFEGISKV